MEAPPSHLPSLPLEPRGDFKVASVVDRLGLGDTYISHTRKSLNASNVKAPTQDPLRPTASASDNKVQDASIAATAGQINAPLLAGVKGASNGVDQTAHFSFNFIMNGNPSASNEYSINNNTEPPGSTIDETDTTSRVKSSISTSKDATEEKISISADVTSTGGMRTTLASSALVTKVNERQTAPLPCTIQEFDIAFQEMTERTIVAYKKTSSLLSQYRRSSKQANWRRSLQIHEASIQGRSLEIHKVLRASLNAKSRSKELLQASCDRIHTRLSELQEDIHLFQSQIGSKPRDDSQDEKARLEHLPKGLNTWYEQLVKGVAAYEKATDELIVRQIVPPSQDNSLQRLFIDAQASSTLKQCLCRVCPEECHGFHTAYLKLEPESPNAVSNDLGGENPPAEENPEAMWQYTKDTLIWLKVVSNITVGHQPFIIDNDIPASFDGPEEPGDIPGNEGMQQPSRKRRASSTSLEPASKSQKTRQLHRHLDSGTASIELCPEFLTQHDTTDRALMKIVDNGGCDHSIYYLDEAERSAYGAYYITLNTASPCSG
ncbi:hypothetical protein O1611_g6298 [Lasiodiplodia mahajangana]|uniref:Uncharacterized protein n=1 Tax=Lasiodiplodia mahajangana TaxID=1108764 RepID=A0ACC2JIZ0_9PEZI|nr:hypothetical protein O1611_g6298 [Lasiodiplodia mahajangana]